MSTAPSTGNCETIANQYNDIMASRGNTEAVTNVNILNLCAENMTHAIEYIQRITETFKNVMEHYNDTECYRCNPIGNPITRLRNSLCTDGNAYRTFVRNTGNTCSLINFTSDVTNTPDVDDPSGLSTLAYVAIAAGAILVITILFIKIGNHCFKEEGPHYNQNIDDDTVDVVNDTESSDNEVRINVDGGDESSDKNSELNFKVAEDLEKGVQVTEL